jgi:hypothetical protein
VALANLLIAVCTKYGHDQKLYIHFDSTRADTGTIIPLTHPSLAQLSSNCRMQHHSSSGRFPLVAYVVSEELAKVRTWRLKDLPVGQLIALAPLIRNTQYHSAQASSLLPSNKHRSLLVHSLVSALGVLSLVTLDHQKCFKVLRPRRATQKDLLSYHTRDYLEYALNPSSDYGDQAQISKYGLEDVRTFDCSPFEASYIWSRIALRSVACTSIYNWWQGQR